MSQKTQVDEDFCMGVFRGFFYRIPEGRSEFARRLDVSDSTVAHWEMGERFPTAENITRICRTTRTRADDLLQIPKVCRNAPSEIHGTTAEKIEQLVYEAGLTKAEAARMIFQNESITKGTAVRKWILGVSPSFPSIRRICLAFRVSADWLLNI